MKRCITTLTVTLIVAVSFWLGAASNIGKPGTTDVRRTEIHADPAHLQLSCNPQDVKEYLGVCAARKRSQKVLM